VEEDADSGHNTESVNGGMELYVEANLNAANGR
jgi:hypothetical protein